MKAFLLIITFLPVMILSILAVVMKAVGFLIGICQEIIDYAGEWLLNLPGK